jgi:hypothetical protein
MLNIEHRTRNFELRIEKQTLNNERGHLARGILEERLRRATGILPVETAGETPTLLQDPCAAFRI